MQYVYSDIKGPRGKKLRAPPSGRAEDIFFFLFSIFAAVAVYAYMIPPSPHPVHLTIIIITTIVVVGVVYVYISICVCVCTIIQARTTNGSRYLNDGGHNIRITYILYKYSPSTRIPPLYYVLIYIYIVPYVPIQIVVYTPPRQDPGPARSTHAYLCNVYITQAQSTQYIIYFSLL